MSNSRLRIGAMVVFGLGLAAASATLLPGQSRSDEAQQAGSSTANLTRREFLAAMSQVKVGMSEKDVLAILGEPDDIETEKDPSFISYFSAVKIWAYGTNGHRTFPTLGCVLIDKEGKVRCLHGGKEYTALYLYGRDAVLPDPREFPEEELRKLLRLIDQAPSYNPGYRFDPKAIIHIVNTLQPLGKEKALTVIDEYLRVASHLRPAREGLFLVLRVLFDVPADPGYMPRMLVGALMPPGPENPRAVPRYPVFLVDDVPLLLDLQILLIGEAEPVETHVKYFREKGRIRARPLTPGKKPLDLYDCAVTAIRKYYEDKALTSSDKEHPGAGLRAVKVAIANQLMNLVDSVYRREVDDRGYKWCVVRDQDSSWKQIRDEVDRLDIRWNSEQCQYTFKDGSHCPESIRKRK